MSVEVLLEEISSLRAKGKEVADAFWKERVRGDELEEKIASLEKRLEKAREALIPFAAQAEDHHRRGNGRLCNNCGQNYPCDFRTAQEALEAIGKI